MIERSLICDVCHHLILSDRAGTTDLRETARACGFGVVVNGKDYCQTCLANKFPGFAQVQTNERTADA